MKPFPRSIVGGVSLSRMIIGTNWLLGWSHCTRAKDKLIKDSFADPRRIADVLEVFFRAGIDTVMGNIQMDNFHQAVREAEDRTGVRAVVVSTPTFPTNPSTPVEGFDMNQVQRILDAECERGATFCMPHQCTTDAMVDRCVREIRQFGPLCAAIRERGLVPGLSTHMPEAIVYADESGLDVETYISIFNSMGFLMTIEVDWVQRMIRHARRPVMVIKPMAAGQLRPLQALTFVWNVIRDCDMVTVGTASPDEAAELSELSRGMLERRAPELPLQETRSKAAVKPRA
ncbi:MAG: hypothetical protein M1457_06815 [bacterium]|nr:hypothetical protein [bacterium]